MSKCSSCGAEIEWVKTEKGKSQPLDPKPSLVGNVELRDGISYYIHNEERAGRMLRVAHFATCPNAKAHRQREKSPAPVDACKICHRLAPLIDGECPNCRH